MTPNIIEGWELETIQENLLYRYKRTIGQNELTLDINVEKSPKDLWGHIFDPQDLKNSIHIIYDPVYQRWSSKLHVYDVQSDGFSGEQKPGPSIMEDFDTLEDLAEFLEKLANEIDRTGWESVKSQTSLAFT